MRGIVTIIFASALGACLEAPDKLTEQQFREVVETLQRPDADADIGEVEPDTEPDVDPDTVPDSDEVTPEIGEPDGEVTPEITEPDGEVTLEVTEPEPEVVPEVIETTETTETQDCTTEPVPPECLPTTRRLTLYEPAHTDGEMGPPESLVRKERPDGTSTWARAAEPIEIALSNGSLDDPDLDAHFAFEDALTSSRDGYTLGGPQVFYEAGQANFGKALRIAPRFVANVPASRTASLTVMGWIRIDQVVTATYDVLGFGNEGPPFSPELALGIANGQWSALVAGTSIPFGALSAGWQHVAFTWDEGRGRVTLYLDGVVRAVATPAFDLVGDEFFIGAAFPQGRHSFGMPPYADEVSVYRRALTPAEVAAQVQSSRPLGAALLPTQPDYDDLRVYVDADPIAREIIGRRPHGDSGAETEGLFGIWRLDDGALTATAPREGFAGVLDEIALTTEAGVFGDADGAIRAPTQGKGAIAHQRSSTWGSALTIELWVRVAATEVGVTCTNTTDGATLLVAQDGQATLAQGFALRLCDGKVDFATSGGSVRSLDSIADDQWHHVMASYSATEHRVIIDGVVSATATTTSTPADLMRGITLLHRPPLPEDEELPIRMTNAALDEIVLHDSVKSEGYAMNRAWPVLPHLRVLVATRAESAGRFPLPELELRAGNAAVRAPKINACDSLVSPCTDYVAWWRFEGDVNDASSAALHLALTGSPAWSTGLDGGLAIVLDGQQTLTRQQVTTPDVTRWGLEAGVDPTTNASYTLIERPGAGQPPNVPLLYALALNDLGKVRQSFAPSGPPGETLVSEPAIGESWTAIGSGYDGTLSSVVVGTDITSVDPTLSPLPGQQSGPIFIARGGREEQPEHFVGGLDAVRIMSRALTPAERFKYPRLAWQPAP